MDLVLRFIRCPTVHLLNVVVPIAFREKENMYLLLNSFFQIVFCCCCCCCCCWNAETIMEKLTEWFYPLLEKKSKATKGQAQATYKFLLVDPNFKCKYREQQWEWFGQHFIITTYSSNIYIIHPWRKFRTFAK